MRFLRYLRFEFSIGNLAVSVSSSKAYSYRRLAIATLRAPDARFAQSKEASIRFRVYVPTLRCRYVATARLNLLSL